MVAGDFNNDGILDLIVGDEDGTLTLSLGDGTGSFYSAHEIDTLLRSYPSQLLTSTRMAFWTWPFRTGA